MVSQHATLPVCDKTSSSIPVRRPAASNILSVAFILLLSISGPKLSVSRLATTGETKNDREDQTCLVAYFDRSSDTDKLRRLLASFARKQMQVEIRAACPSAARYSAYCSVNPRKG